jgi:signal transduction histidine kinase
VVARCDALRIGQVLRNLLSNAIKFTGPGGEVVVEVGPAAQPAGAVRVSVTDNGVGIPHDELERIFEKFIQSSRTRSNAGGTGLGLAICREIIAAHGGRIWAESGAGAGSRFVFVLPGAHEPAAQGSRSASDAALLFDQPAEGSG